MRKILLGLVILGLWAGQANGADEKIDPGTYICAELVASSVNGVPPIFEALQLDGFAAARAGKTVAHPEGLEELLFIVFDSCAAKPEDNALEHWQMARRQIAWQDDGSWRADKTTCADYQANTEDGSGFMIWLDGYQRAKTGKGESVFSSQEVLDKFLDVCAKNPQRLVYDVMVENAR